MTDLDTYASTQTRPFDAIRRADEHGEYWSARDLMLVMGYDKWERFADVIDRARVSAASAGHDPDQHLSRLREGFRAPGARGPAGVDYRLTRFGAYLAAMNGDVRKLQVAEAQTYFAVRTRQAEIGQLSIPQTYAQALQAAADAAKALEQSEAQRAIEAPKVAAYDRVIETNGLFSMTGIADMCGTSVNKFTGWLADLGVFRKGEYAPFPGRRLPRKQHQDSGLFDVRIERNDQGVNYPVAYATPAGLDFTLTLLRENGLID